MDDKKDLKDSGKREAFKSLVVDPIKSFAQKIKETESGSVADVEIKPRSYENSEIKRLFEICNVLKDFDEDLPKQWQNIRNSYRKDFPDNLEDFSFFLETDWCETEIEEAKHRYGEKILAKFSEQELKQIIEFYESDFGKKILQLNEQMREDLRQERTTIARTIGGRLDATTKQIREGKKQGSAQND